jgi:hypothetical protein
MRLAVLAIRSTQMRGGWSNEAITGVVGAVSATVMAVMVPVTRCWWQRRRQHQAEADVQSNPVGALVNKSRIANDGKQNFARHRKSGPHAGRAQDG